jgi:hypothetical protein
MILSSPLLGRIVVIIRLTCEGTCGGGWRKKYLEQIPKSSKISKKIILSIMVE